ncbi:hypothetical protein [Cryptosporangium phraense]|uniref:DUF4328 domain-containing protein n=1 Tax=Cryptosporangium phraense TaxID=2593070 RepID=A0A545ADS8_9ACTN|nr:hypothetical protein [Cryptosporangium phraense]TQS39493.1 hypothetical protein FL583_39790 [Cryptosporangium phraense]
MDSFIAWCGFLGAWLLVAGPVYQAAIELSDQQLELDDVEKLSEDIEHSRVDGAPPPISGWWWLFPPVLWIKHRRREKAARELLLSRLTPAQVQLAVDYLNKATGWGLVGLGGLLIALKETWELLEHYEWEHWVFWLLAVVMAVLCLANAGLRMQRSQSIIENRRTASHPEMSG